MEKLLLFFIFIAFIVGPSEAQFGARKEKHKSSTRYHGNREIDNTEDLKKFLDERNKRKNREKGRVPAAEDEKNKKKKIRLRI